MVMGEEDDQGVEILDSAVSTTSTAVTHEMDTKNVQVSTAVDAASSVAVEDQGNTNAPNTGGDEEQQAALAAAGMEPEQEQGAAGEAKEQEVQRNRKSKDQPFDEPAVGSVPISHVAPQAADHADDVSSLQHSHINEKNSHAQQQQRYYADQEQSREDAIEEGTTEYYEEEVEQQKALQRRNMLIIIMLIIFLGLVVAIGVGVGMAVKNNDSNPDNSSKEAQGPPPKAQPTNDDDEYPGIGGGIDNDDLFSSPVPSASPSNEGPCIPIEIGIIFDNYSDETGWMLVKGNYYPEDVDKNVVVWQSKFYNKQEFSGRADTMTKCFSQGYYTFVFTDKEGDGVCCYHGDGSYVLSSEGKVIKIGGAMKSNEESVVFELPFVEPEPVDKNKDGMDDRLGLLMPYDSSNMTEGVDCEMFRMAILTDEYGIETTWELFEGKDRTGELIANGGPYGSEYTYVIDYCLASPKEYVLYMYDWDRRGLCCESGEGWYMVESGDITIIDKYGEFGEENVTRFVLPADGSVVISDEPTPMPSTLVPLARKTLYPTVTPVTKSPTSPPTPTPPPTVRLSTPFPTIPAPDVVDVGGLPTTLGKVEDDKGKNRRR